jgi:hypothetical protein
VHIDAAVHDDAHTIIPWCWKDRVCSGSTFILFGGGYTEVLPGFELTIDSRPQSSCSII